MITKLIYIIAFFAFSLVNLNANWEKVTNMPAKFLDTYWLDVYFLETNTDLGWVCGYGGSILRTSDGGETWLGTTITDTDQLESIHFVNPNVGYTSGEGSIFKSIDGGATWRDISPIDPEILLWGTYFLTEDLGFVVGGNCNGPQRFYRTTNGGTTWSSYYSFFPNTKLSDLMIDPATGIGYAASSGLIWKTTDTGKTWSIFSRTGGMDWHEEITNIGKSFLVPYSVGCDGTTTGQGGVRFSTTNGNSWIDFRTQSPMYGTFLLDSLRGWACGIGEEIYYTADGGKSWTLENCGLDPGAGLDDIRFLDDTTGWVVGQGLYRYRRNSIPQPTITALGDVQVCKGDSVELALEGNFGYILWSTGDTTKTIKVSETGTYSVFVRNSKCEYAYSNEIAVFVRPSPAITIQSSHQNPPCIGDTVYLDIVSPFDNLKWSTGETSSRIAITESGTYQIVLQDDFGCIDSTTIDINFNDLPDPIITALTRTNVCIGDSVLLQIVPNYPNVVWHSTTKRNLATGNYYLTGDEGEYFAEVYDQNGCFGISDKMSVTVRNETNRLVFLIDTTRKEFFVDSTRYPELACRYLTIRNISDMETALRNPKLFYNLSFSLPQSQFPLIFGPREEKTLLICYSPRNLRYERDTLIVEDVCNDHNIPILAFGNGNIYPGNTRCDVPIELETIKINSGTTFITSSAYPNPTSKTASIPFSAFISKSEPSDFSVQIFDIFGKERASSTIDLINSEELETGLLQYGSFDINLDKLPRGVYIAKISLGRKTEIQRIILE